MIVLGILSHNKNILISAAERSSWFSLNTINVVMTNSFMHHRGIDKLISGLRTVGAG